MTSKTILAVVKNIAVHEQEAAEWAKHKIGAIRVDTMHEAIVKLKNGEKFFFVVINEDCIPDFLTQLPIMRDVTNFPIIVVTSTYTMDKKIIAMRSGADLYVPFSEKIEHDALVTLEVFSAQNRWSNRPAMPPVLSAGDIVLSPSRHVVFVKDKLIDLSPQEFDALHLLIKDKGRVLKHEEIYGHLFGVQYNKDTDEHILHNLMKRLRKKIREHTDLMYIESVYKIGYTLYHDYSR